MRLEFETPFSFQDKTVPRGTQLVGWAALVHEFIVLPTRRMQKGEEDYALAFSIPVNAPGIRIINKMIDPPNDSTFDYPISNRYRMPEGFVVFDDVFIPWERVLLCGEIQGAGKLAGSLGLWERVQGLADMVERARTLVGMAQLLADYNGTSRQDGKKVPLRIVWAALSVLCTLPPRRVVSWSWLGGSFVVRV